MPQATGTAMREEEHTLQLPNNRQLVYADNGNRASRTVVLFFSGYLSVGTAPSIPAPLRELDVHWISPTLPGNAESSAIRGAPYNVGLCQDMTRLLEHLHPGGLDALYVAGGSYGTVQAQMLYGAPYGLFPIGRSIAGLLLLGPLSPFRAHAGYSRSMTWQNWISVGPVSQWVPFRAVPRLVSVAIGSKVKDVATAKAFMHDFIIKPMDAEERRELDDWLARQREDNGDDGSAPLTQDRWLERMAEGAVRCARSWDGFLEGSDVLHSDWGFVPAELDADHRRPPVLIVASDKDELGHDMYRWLSDNYANSALRVLHGGHLAATFHMDELWAELLAMRRSQA